jgi:hypothetical protein
MRTLQTIGALFLGLACAGPAVSGTISGQVLDEHGLPVAGVDLDFIVVSTGQEESANNDVTDFNGMFSTTVDPEVYDVQFSPPPGVRLAGHEETSVNLNVNQSVNVVLRDAWLVGGRLLRVDTGLAAVGVDLDFENLATGEKLFTPLDDSGLDGRYSVAVPTGIYRITFDGPVPEFPTDPAQLAHGMLEEITIDGSGDVELPELTLKLGYHVDGELLDPQGNELEGADLDFILPATGQKIFTKTDNTDSRGRFDTIVPLGIYDVEISPPQGEPLASRILTSQLVGADTTLGSMVLDEGFAVVGPVVDPDGHPLREVDLDLVDSATGQHIPTAFDDSDATGQYRVHVLPGVYDFDYTPVVNSLVEPQSTSSVTVNGPESLPVVVLPYHDEDADGTVDLLDNCPFRANGLQDDRDNDGVGDLCDNCSADPNPRQEDNDRDLMGDACDIDDDGDGIVDLIDPDIDGDGIANALDNCPQAANDDLADSDADGVGDACDPDDGIVEFLEARSRTGLHWRAESGALGYQVYRNNLAWLSTMNFGICAHDTAEGTSMVDSDTPAAGTGFTYLVTAVTATGEGGLGRRSDGTERPNLRPCP